MAYVYAIKMLERKNDNKAVSIWKMRLGRVENRKWGLNQSVFQYLGQAVSFNGGKGIIRMASLWAFYSATYCLKYNKYSIKTY